jgi:hypothetical protein
LKKGKEKIRIESEGKGVKQTKKKKIPFPICRKASTNKHFSHWPDQRSRKENKPSGALWE